jgi:hypothetical protein
LGLQSLLFCLWRAFVPLPYNLPAWRGKRALRVSFQVLRLPSRRDIIVNLKCDSPRFVNETLCHSLTFYFSNSKCYIRLPGIGSRIFSHSSRLGSSNGFCFLVISSLAFLGSENFLPTLESAYLKEFRFHCIIFSTSK